jgi:chemotaxis protein CheX
MTASEAGLSKDEAIALIRSSTERVFSTMLGCEVKISEATEEQIRAHRKGGVLAVVGLSGPWKGSGTVRCSGPVACSISGKFLMTEYEIANDEVLDAMGEIANMVIGNFKDDAADKLGPLGLSTPTVVYGINFEARNWNGDSWVNVLFDYEGGLLEVSISLVPSKVP